MTTDELATIKNCNYSNVFTKNCINNNSFNDSDYSQCNYIWLAGHVIRMNAAHPTETLTFIKFNGNDML
jgi:hypothetical protein